MAPSSQYSSRDMESVSSAVGPLEGAADHSDNTGNAGSARGAQPANGGDGESDPNEIVQPFPDKDPDALATDSPPPSDDEAENEAVLPLRRRFSRRSTTITDRGRAASHSSGRRHSAASISRAFRRRSSADGGNQSAEGQPAPQETGENDNDDGDDEEQLPGLKRVSTGTRQKSLNVIIERFLEEIEEEEGASHSLWSALYDAFCSAARQLYRPDFFRFDVESLKIIFRTWACGWIGVILMVILPVDRWLGSGSFILPMLGLLGSPGGLSVANAIFSGLAESAFVAWALLCVYIAEAIQWAVRGYPTKQGIMEELAAEGLCAIGDAQCLRTVVLSGRYLRIDVTVITIFRLVVTLWVVGLFEQFNPRLFKIPFVMVLIIIFPTLPTDNATPYMSFWDTYRSSVINFYFAVALKLLTCFLIFPITSNNKYINVLTQVTRNTKTEADSFFGLISREKPSNETFKDTFKNIAATCTKLSSHFFKFDIDAMMMRLEVSFSRLDSGDIGEFRSRIREVIYSLNSVHFFLINVQNRKEMLFDVMKSCARENHTENHSRPRRPHLPRLSTHLRDYSAQKYKPAAKFEFMSNAMLKTLEKERLEGLSLSQLDEFYALTVAHYHPAIQAATCVLGEVANWLEEANSFRLWSLFSPYFKSKRQKGQIYRRESLIESLKTLEGRHAELVKGFASYRNQIENFTSKGTGTYLFILAQDSFLHLTASEYINRIHRLARYCSHLDNVKPKPQWISPFTKPKSKSLGIAMFDFGADVTEQSDVNGFVPLHQVEKRDPDVTLPRTHFHYFALRVEKVLQWFLSPTTMFNTKRAFAAILPFTIFFVRQTLAFGVSCHAVWVSVIFVMTIARQAVDGAYGFITRLYATFLGCILGMLIWYISSGSGHGNSYGLAASCAVAFVIIACHRHFNTDKVPLGSIVFCISTVLIFGNSWATTYSPQVGVNLGRGWRVCWLRFVTVVIGISLAFFITMFPYPSTGKVAIREGLGVNQKQLGEIMSSIVNFGLQRLDNPDIHFKRRSDPIRSRFKVMSNKILAVSRVASMMKFEPTLTGVWPSKRYQFLMTMQQEIISLLSLTLLLLNKVEQRDTLAKLVREMGLVDLEQLTGAYSVFHMTGNALLTKTALPSITPGNLSFRHLRHISKDLNTSAKVKPIVELAGELYTSYDGRLRLAALAVSELMYDSIDATMLIVKGLVGESFDTDARVYFFENEH